MGFSYSRFYILYIGKIRLDAGGPGKFLGEGVWKLLMPWKAPRGRKRNLSSRSGKSIFCDEAGIYLWYPRQAAHPPRHFFNRICLIFSALAGSLLGLVNPLRIMRLHRCPSGHARPGTPLRALGCALTRTLHAPTHPSAHTSARRRPCVSALARMGACGRSHGLARGRADRRAYPCVCRLGADACENTCDFRVR